jgi:hypothetical protein
MHDATLDSTVHQNSGQIEAPTHVFMPWVLAEFAMIPCYGPLSLSSEPPFFQVAHLLSHSTFAELSSSQYLPERCVGRHIAYASLGMIAGVMCRRTKNIAEAGLLP